MKEGWLHFFRPRGFRQLLLFYSLLVILVILVSGSLVFSAMSAMLDRIQGQTNVYIVINELTAGLMESRAVFAGFIPAADASREEEITRHAGTMRKLREDLEGLKAPYGEAPEQYFLYNGIGNGLTYISQIRDALAARDEYAPHDYAAYYSALNVYNYLLDYVCNRYLSASINTNARTLAQIQREASSLRFWGLGIVIFIVIFSVIAVRRMSDILTRPIREMVKTAGEITRGNLDTPDIVLSGPDELTFLERSMNQMKTSLREWIQTTTRNAELEKILNRRELEKAKSKRELDRAKFLLLQTQMNPHFLFNTLNTISRTALFERADTTVDLIEKLAKIFRYTLEYRDDVALGEELQFVSQYLAIQEARFGERVRSSVVCPGELAPVRIPPLIIQPFVENAIIHGLEPLEEGGEIEVRVSPARGRIVITIADTGVGMGAARPTDAEAPGSAAHIGMKNVHDRIALYYGGEARFSAGAGPGGKGTLVRLSLPALVKRGELVAAG
jgi:sensor histidine kinase YesM